MSSAFDEKAMSGDLDTPEWAKTLSEEVQKITLEQSPIHALIALHNAFWKVACDHPVQVHGQVSELISSELRSVIQDATVLTEQIRKEIELARQESMEAKKQ